MALKIKAREKKMKFSQDGPEGQGDQGGCHPQWCFRRRYAGLLEGRRRGHQGLGH